MSLLAPPTPPFVPYEHQSYPKHLRRGEHEDVVVQDANDRQARCPEADGWRESREDAIKAMHALKNPPGTTAPIAAAPEPEPVVEPEPAPAPKPAARRPAPRPKDEDPAV